MPRDAVIKHPIAKLLIGDKITNIGGVAPISTIKKNSASNFRFAYSIAKSRFRRVINSFVFRLSFLNSI